MERIRCPSPRLFEKGTSLDKLLTDVSEAVEEKAWHAAATTKIACNQLVQLCPNYEPSRVVGGALCRSGEDSHGYPYRPECLKGCICSQFSRSGVFSGEEQQPDTSEATPF